MVEHSHELQYQKVCEVVSEEVKKYNAEKGQTLKVVGLWEDPDTHIPLRVHVIKKKDKKLNLFERIGKYIDLFKAYDSLIFITTKDISVKVDNLEYERLAKIIEVRLNT